MAHMSRPMKKTGASAEQRTVSFRAYTISGSTPKNDLTPGPAKLRINGADGIDSENSFTLGEDGAYNLIIDQTAELDTLDEGDHVLVGVPDDTGYTIVWGEFVVDSPLTPAEQLIAQFAALDGFMQNNGSITIGGVTLTVGGRSALNAPTSLSA